MWFIQFASGCSDLQKDAGAPSKAIVRPPVQRGCREKFETDDDSFDTVVHRWKSTLKTKGMIHRGFGIPIAMSQHRAAMGEQERRYLWMIETSVAAKKGSEGTCDPGWATLEGKKAGGTTTICSA